MRVSRWWVLTILAPLGCATVDHGRVNAHGDANGVDWSIAPTACLSGTATTPPSDAVVFSSNGAAGPAVIKIVGDPANGPRIQLIRLVNGNAVAQTFDRSQCVALNLTMTPTGWVINDVPQVQVKAQIDCTANGVNVAGTINFGSCGFSREVVRVLDSLAGAPNPEEVARLAKLPRVPQRVDVPVMPAGLRGLTFRAQGHLTGAPTGNETVAHGEQVCASTAEQTFARAGWTLARDPNAPVDLVVDIHCTGHVSWVPRGGAIEFLYPASDGPALTFSHDGRVVETVPRGPADFVCEAAGATDDDRFRDCVARAQQMADARIFGVIAASQNLAQLARR